MDPRSRRDPRSGRNMITIRDYRSSDAKEIVKWIHTEEEFRLWSANCFKVYPMTAQDLIEYYDSFKDADYYFPMTACDEDGIFGHFIFRFLDEEHKLLRMGFVIVDDLCRGMGYGKAMMNKALEYAFEVLKVDKVTLGVFEQNKAAYECYLSVGFEVDPEKPAEEYLIGKEKWTTVELYCVCEDEKERA